MTGKHLVFIRLIALFMGILCFGGIGLFPTASQAEEPSAKETPDAKSPLYETDIAPIFQAHCIRCHNPKAKKADFDLSTPKGLFSGGESGDVLVTGNLEESLLYDMVLEGAMPPEEDKQLSAKEIETIRLWIEAGTPFASKIDPAELAAASEVDNHVIEPIMLLRCAACHGLRKQEAGLDLRTKASMLKGGKSGPAIVLGKPEESLLLKKIHSGAMPPPDKLIVAGVKPIPSNETEQIARWIEIGAPEVAVIADVASTTDDPLVSEEDRQFWAFQSPRDVAPPAVKDSARVRNPIDAFVIRKLEEKGLTLSPETDKIKLLRRAYFDLIGLPPKSEEIEAFLADKDPQSFEKLIDRLLESPRYGERWGRFWLDAAGYADSEGKRSADPLRPYAYKYRDYVIRAFNADKPYDRFLLEQIAGDELADYENAETITNEMVDNLIATGFLRMAPDGTGSDVVNFVPERLEVVSDEIDIFGSTVLGLTLKYARCHSHKYDPIPQRDYYRLVDVFKGAMDEHDWLKPAFVPGQTKIKKPGRVLAYATAEQMQVIDQKNKEIDQEIKTLGDKKAELAKAVRKKHTDEQLAKIPKQLHEDLRKLLSTAADKRDEVLKYLAEKFEKTISLTDKQLKGKQGYSRAATKIDREIKSLEGEKADGPNIRALWDRGQPSPTYIYQRGDFTQPGTLVGPGVPSVLTDGKTPFQPTPPWPGAKKTGRRLALAKWLVDENHPLTSRVMVNRIWKHHFGYGIVRSLGNFGKLGDRPTHPELLDWLAREFMNRGWSMKEMHRLIMTSSVYRQSSQLRQESAELDEDNKLLSRMPLQRLDAEQLYDSLVYLSGKMNETPFGRPDGVDVAAGGLVTPRAMNETWRRSIYVRQRRKEIPTVLETFDLPQMNPNCQQRTNSTVAQQALYLLNDSAVRKFSVYFAERVLAETSDPIQQVRRVYMLALSRPPNEEEQRIAVDVLLKLTEQWKEELKIQNQPIDTASEKALAVFSHTIVNSASFLYVD